MATLAEITAEVNQRVADRPIGRLQGLRKTHLRLERMPSTELFSHPKKPGWTFHKGGRTELQFNLGLEDSRDGTDFRYGVAFSFETSRSFPSFTELSEKLLPKVARFNEYVRENSEELAGLSMWHFTKGRKEQTRSVNYDPMPIPEALVRQDVFVFLGGHGRSDAPDYAQVLDVLDRLLPLYLFVEGHRDEPVAPPVLGTFEFRPGCPPRLDQTQATLRARKLSIRLRHNALQRALYDKLAEEFGADNVGAEVVAAGGGYVDMVVRHAEAYEFYEIKLGPTARSCIRQALGQLLDYACWPGGPRVTKLVVVGEPPLLPDTAAYLEHLNERFPIELRYMQVSCD